MNLYAEAVAFQPAEITVVTDAYSKAYELEIGYQQKTLEQVVELLNDSAIQKSSIALEGAEFPRYLTFGTNFPR